MSNRKPSADEDDLDDLDDVLDQFTKPPLVLQPNSGVPAPASSSLPSQAKSPPILPESDNDALSAEFAKQLAAEMELMMRNFGGQDPVEATASSSTGATSSDTQANEAVFREAWNKMMLQDLEDGGKGNGPDSFLGRGDERSEDVAPQAKVGQPATGKEKEAIEGEDPFQKTIRQAMEKLKDSDDTLKADTQGGQDNLEGLLASLGDFNLDEDGAEGGEGFGSMLETMMSQLMSKEILYEPLKELDTKYPDYLAQNSSTLSPEELSRYTDQKTRVSHIVAMFENPSYADDDAVQSAEILRLMNEMQSFGSPPSEIMGPMPPGFDLGADGLPNLPEGCIIL